MKCTKESLLLYGVTDRRWLDGRKLCDVVKESVEGGATFIQLREKELEYSEFLAEALELKELCREYNVPFVINDNVEIALKSDADGVHVGQDDMESGQVRKLLGAEKIIGVSAQTVEQAVEAEKNGADYIGVGAVFTTGSKDDAVEVDKETLKNICDTVSIPVVAIGGINSENVKELKGTGICGAAVISALYGKKDIKKAAENMKNEIKGILE